MEIINPIVITLPGDKKNSRPVAETMGCSTDGLLPPHVKSDGGNGCKYYDPCPTKGKGR
jgi:hypothetical protein